MSPRVANVALGVPLLLAFSPGLYDLGAHWIANPWSRYSAVFVPLLAWAAWRERGAAPLRGLGVSAIAAGMLLQLLAAMSVMPALGRPAVALAAIGFLLLRGLASPGCAALAIFVVPIPYTFTRLLAGDSIARELFRTAERLVGLVGGHVAAGTHQVVSGDASLSVEPWQAGLPVAVAAVGLAWWAFLRAAPSVAQAARWLPALVVAAAVAQFLAVVLACLALMAGSGAVAAFVVDTFGWLALSAAVVFGAERRRRSPA